MSQFLRPFLLSSLLIIVTSEHNGTANNEFLNLHNTARVHAHLPPFIWDVKLELYARNYAAKRSSDCSLTHSDGPYGENLFWGSGNQWTPRDVVKLWVKEHKYYDRVKNACMPERLCGHYTQIVWRDSIRLGCALGQCENGDTFAVCSYDPPGNYVGEMPFLHNAH